jgi:hypothetical protein
MALWSPTGKHLATHSYKGTVYHINKTQGPDACTGCELFYIHSGKRKPGRDAPQGPQDAMISNAFCKSHAFFVAFDVNIGTKAFGSYPSSREFYDSMSRFKNARRANTGYEIIRESGPTRLYMDIEWIESDNKSDALSRDPLVLIPLVLRELISYLKETFILCASLTMDDFCISRSRNPERKQSYHVYMWNRAVFVDNHQHLRAIMFGFYQHLVMQLITKSRTDLEPIFFSRTCADVRGGGCIIDLSVYTRNRQLRPIGAVKKTDTSRVLVAFDIVNNVELVDPLQMPYDQWSRYLASPPADHNQPILGANSRLMALLGDTFNPVKVNSQIQQSLALYFTNKHLSGAMRLQLDEFINFQTTSAKRSGSGAAAEQSVPTPRKRALVNSTGQIELFESKSLDEYVIGGKSNSQNAARFSSLLDDLRRDSQFSAISS